MNYRSAAVCLLGVALLVAAPAPALINPNFTPIHLALQSDLILKAKLEGKASAEGVKLTVVEVIKGKAGKTIVVDLSKAPKQHREAAVTTLNATPEAPVLFLAGTYDQVKVGYLHVNGTWFRLPEGAEDKWSLQGTDENMPATWAGGTDMLERCLRYVLESQGAATVPVEAGTGWRGIVQAGSVKGKAGGVAGVDLAGDGKLVLHVACPAGDVLLKAKGKDAFEDVTGKLKLAAASAAAVWGDFNGDGRADLVSFDGKALRLFAQAADGTFGAAAEVKADLPKKVLGLAVVGLGAKGAPVVVVSGSDGLVVLACDGAGKFAPVKLPAAPAEAAKYGAGQAAVVADFNGDGFPDIIQPYEKDGLLYAASADGAIEAPKTCDVNCTEGGGSSAVADFDADGWPDVLTAGSEGVRVWQNLHNGRFAESLGLSGEMAYKAQPFASACGVCDFNNDGRADVFITYSNQPPLLYFNRGFRSFGQAPKLELALNDVEGLTNGQQTGCFADLDGDGAQDFVLVLPNGNVHVAFNDLGGEGLGIKVRLDAKDPTAGPVRVWAVAGKQTVGALQVSRAAPPALIGVAEAGNVLLKWQFPGKKVQEKKVTVEDKPVEFVLPVTIAD